MPAAELFHHDRPKGTDNGLGQFCLLPTRLIRANEAAQVMYPESEMPSMQGATALSPLVFISISLLPPLG